MVHIPESIGRLVAYSLLLGLGVLAWLLEVPVVVVVEVDGGVVGRENDVVVSARSRRDSYPIEHP